MTRTEFDRRESLLPGTWQNRQGREDEWHAASASSTGFALVVMLVGATAFVSLCAVVGCQLAIWVTA